MIYLGNNFIVYVPYGHQTCFFGILQAMEWHVTGNLLVQLCTINGRFRQYKSVPWAAVNYVVYLLDS